MEVSGKRDGHSVASKKDTFLCQPCSDDGQQREAEGFCQNCQEYLCDECCKHHRKLTVTKHHVIKDKHNMPMQSRTKRKTTVCTERCKQHQTEIVKFYCKQHNVVGCGDCIIIGHKQCQVEHIHELADRFVETKEYKELLSTIEEIQKKISNKKDTLEKKTADVEESYKEAVREIHKFRQTINGYLDKAEQELLRQCEERKQENEENIRDHEDHLKSVKQELDEMMATLKLKESNVADLFVEANRTMSCLKRVAESLHRPEPTIGIMKFLRNTSLDNIVVQDDTMGRLFFDRPSSTADINPVPSGSFNVSSENDENECWISSMVSTPSGDILCADYNNKSMKVIDVKKNQLSCELSLSSGPWDITAVEERNQYATTLPDDKKIQLIRFDNNLTMQGCISTDGKCKGIAYHDQKMIVSFVSPPKIQVLSLQGNVIQTVDNTAMFDFPAYVAIDHRKPAVYVSDYSKHCVIEMTMNGNIMSTYKDTDFQYPRGMFVCEDGGVLVCRDRECYDDDSKDACIHVISSDLEKIKIVFKDDKTVKDPSAVCCNETTKHLCISNMDSDALLVYNMY